MEFEVPFFKHVEIPEYDDIKDWKVISPKRSIATGDVLLFSGSSLISSGLKFFTFSRWNHIGMACWVELTMKDETKQIELFCFELGSQPYTDLITKKKIDKGVRLVRLADIAIMYDIIALRKIRARRDEAWIRKFQAFMLRWSATPFFSFSTTVKAYYVTPGSNKNETTCAQLTANMLEHMNVNMTKFDTSQVSPEHFTFNSKAFEDKIFIGPEVVIYRDPGKINIRLIFVSLIMIFILIIIMIIFFKVKSNKEHKQE